MDIIFKLKPKNEQGVENTDTKEEISITKSSNLVKVESRRDTWHISYDDLKNIVLKLS